LLKIKKSGGSRDWVVLNSDALGFIKLRKEKLRRDKNIPGSLNWGTFWKLHFMVPSRRLGLG